MLVADRRVVGEGSANRLGLLTLETRLEEWKPEWVEGWVGRFGTGFFIEDYGGHRFRHDCWPFVFNGRHRTPKST